MRVVGARGVRQVGVAGDTDLPIVVGARADRAVAVDAERACHRTIIQGARGHANGEVFRRPQDQEPGRDEGLAHRRVDGEIYDPGLDGALGVRRRREQQADVEQAGDRLRNDRRQLVVQPRERSRLERVDRIIDLRGIQLTRVHTPVDVIPSPVMPVRVTKIVVALGLVLRLEATGHQTCSALSMSSALIVDRTSPRTRFSALGVSTVSPNFPRRTARLTNTRYISSGLIDAPLNFGSAISRTLRLIVRNRCARRRGTSVAASWSFRSG